MSPNPYKDVITEKDIYALTRKDLAKMMFFWRRKPHHFARFLNPREFGDMSDLHSHWMKACIIDWVEDVYSKGIKEFSEIMLQCHRSSYKTTSMVCSIVWALIRQPNIQIAILQASADLAKSRVEQVSWFFRQEHVLALASRCYGADVKLSNDNKTKITLSSCSNSEGYNLAGWGKSSKKTSKHPDLIIVDDLVNSDDMTSDKHRVSSENVFRETTNLLGGQGRRVITGTPWHSDDVYSKIPKKVSHFFPIMDEARLNEMLSDELVKSYIQGQCLDLLIEKSINDKYKGADTDIKNFNASGIIKTYTELPYHLFAKNYLLKNVAPEENLFAYPKIVPRETFIKEKTLISKVYHIDKAFGGDMLAITMLEKYSHEADVDGKKLKVHSYLALGWGWKKKIDIPERIFRIVNEKGYAPVYTETNDDKGATIMDIKRRFPKITIKCYHEKTSKGARIYAHLSPNWRDIFIDENTDHKYLIQIKDWHDGKTGGDDAPDSLACACKILSKNKTHSDDKKTSMQDYFRERRYLMEQDFAF